MTSQRSCGGCSTCCEILGFSAMQKPAWQRCKHQCDTGCAIQDRKPTECSGFECVWLASGGLREEDRPDKLGIFFMGGIKSGIGGDEGWLYAFETEPGKFNCPNARTIIRSLFREMEVAEVEIYGVEIYLYGQIGIVVHSGDLDSMEEIVENWRHLGKIRMTNYEEDSQ